MPVAVCIPSYQEADSIAGVVVQADHGLARLFGPADCVIVNVDGDSPDGTAGVFRATPTRCRKESFVLTEAPGGKGRNLLRFFRYCVEHGVAATATLDADVTTVTPDWIDALLGPVVRSEADYVTPLYRRNRFEGATTNHFAYPLLYGCSGLDIRQPIGGDFGLSLPLVRYLLERPADGAVHGYGIDIFMSAHAVGGGFRVLQAPLGHKLHKPSFPKRARIFRDAATAGIAASRHYPLSGSEGEAGSPAPCIDDSRDFPHERQAREQFAEARARAAALELVYRAWLGGAATDLARALGAAEPRMRAESWAELLAAAVTHALGDGRTVDAGLLAEHLAPAYMLRTVTFWLDSRTRDPLAVEAEVVAQARLFRARLLARTGIRA